MAENIDSALGKPLEQLLNPRLLEQEGVQDSIKIETLAPQELLSSQRFDIFAKHIYARLRENSFQGGWHTQVYSEHIRVFNGFVENDSTQKCGLPAFLETFNRTLESIKAKGYSNSESIVPVGANGIILDGAHRLTACLLYRKPLIGAHISLDAPSYDYRYFQNKGLQGKILDAMAIECCRILDDTFIVTVFPTAQGKDEELVSILKEHGEIFYRKEVILVNDGPFNLIRQIYSTESWVGDWSNDFAGARNKAAWCFQHHEPIRVFVVRSELSRMVQAKDQIRALYRTDKHSVHINDTHPETLLLANLFFNDNSIHFMNHAKVTHYRWFKELLSQFKKWLKDNHLNPEDYCIDSSSVLAAYGIRSARDLDFLHLDGVPNETGFREISSHNQELPNYGHSVDEIINNPNYHFFFDGLKFASLELVGNMKKRRNEPKDLEDLNLIASFLSQQRSGRRVLANTLRQVTPRAIARNIRFCLLYARYRITQVKNFLRRP